jgi:hypothetical protein
VHGFFCLGSRAGFLLRHEFMVRDEFQVACSSVSRRRMVGDHSLGERYKGPDCHHSSR